VREAWEARCTRRRLWTKATPIRPTLKGSHDFVDDCGWQPVYAILARHAYSGSVVQQPLTGLDDDVATTKPILEHEDAPCILLAHSFGGAIFTEAGVDPHVAALVYITAPVLDEGETEMGNGKM